MNFQDTIQKLYEMTSEITIYAAQATDWVNGDHVPSIGIRSYFAGYKNHDPIVDGHPFMICGDVYFYNGKKISDIHDLADIWNYNSEYRVHLRAVSNFLPATVDLGQYKIISRSYTVDNGTVTMTVVRLN